MAPKDPKNTFYRLDRLDKIVDAGGAWDDFAVANAGAKSVKDQILGTELYSHITGRVTQDFVRTMLDVVRKLRRPSVKPYRCDSRTHKRFMEMKIMPEASAGLRVEHRLVLIEPMRVKTNYVSCSDVYQAKVERCSMCNAVRARGQTEWQEPNALTEGSVIYSVCAPCRARFSRPR